VTHLDRAIRYEDNLIYQEPPDWHAPVRQNLGAVLVEAGARRSGGCLLGRPEEEPGNDGPCSGCSGHSRRRARTTTRRSSVSGSTRPGKTRTSN